MVVYPIVYRVSYIPGGCLGFLPSTVFELDSSFAPSIWRHLAQFIFHPILIVTRPSAVPLWCGGKFRKAGEKKPPSPMEVAGSRSIAEVVSAARAMTGKPARASDQVDA